MAAHIPEVQRVCAHCLMADATGRARHSNVLCAVCSNECSRALCAEITACRASDTRVPGVARVAPKFREDVIRAIPDGGEDLEYEQHASTRSMRALEKAAAREATGRAKSWSEYYLRFPDLLERDRTIASVQGQRLGGVSLEGLSWNDMPIELKLAILSHLPAVDIIYSLEGLDRLTRLALETVDPAIQSAMWRAAFDRVWARPQYTGTSSDRLQPERVGLDGWRSLFMLCFESFNYVVADDNLVNVAWNAPKDLRPLPAGREPPARKRENDRVQRVYGLRRVLMAATRQAIVYLRYNPGERGNVSHDYLVVGDAPLLLADPHHALFANAAAVVDQLPIRRIDGTFRDVIFEVDGLEAGTGRGLLFFLLPGSALTSYRPARARPITHTEAARRTASAHAVNIRFTELYRRDHSDRLPLVRAQVTAHRESDTRYVEGALNGLLAPAVIILDARQRQFVNRARPNALLFEHLQGYDNVDARVSWRPGDFSRPGSLPQALADAAEDHDIEYGRMRMFITAEEHADHSLLPPVLSFDSGSAYDGFEGVIRVQLHLPALDTFNPAALPEIVWPSDSEGGELARKWRRACVSPDAPSVPRPTDVLVFPFQKAEVILAEIAAASPHANVEGILRAMLAPHNNRQGELLVEVHVEPTIVPRNGIAINDSEEFRENDSLVDEGEYLTSSLQPRYPELLPVITRVTLLANARPEVQPPLGRWRQAVDVLMQRRLCGAILSAMLNRSVNGALRAIQAKFNAYMANRTGPRIMWTYDQPHSQYVLDAFEDNRGVHRASDVRVCTLLVDTDDNATIVADSSRRDQLAIAVRKDNDENPHKPRSEPAVAATLEYHKRVLSMTPGMKGTRIPVGSVPWDVSCDTNVTALDREERRHRGEYKLLRPSPPNSEIEANPQTPALAARVK